MSELTIHDRIFVIEEPNVLHLLAILRVIGHVGTRAQKVGANFGMGLLSQIIPNDADEPDVADGVAPTADLTTTIFAFLSALTTEDMIEFIVALLQFDSEQAGVHWVRKNPPKLNDVIEALKLNLENLGGITEAISNFTGMVGGMNLAAMLKTSTGTGEVG
ncbi:MAG TPA: hypothetical protein VMX97_14740 [Hyphomicrobiaceae bacterium]|nr:hypothetical protein [Hyphomicrobiaceae bacterium]